MNIHEGKGYLKADKIPPASKPTSDDFGVALFIVGGA